MRVYEIYSENKSKPTQWIPFGIHKSAINWILTKNIIGINRVVLRKDKTLLFVVPNPEVFRKGDTWVVLGEARVEDPNQRAREMAAKKMAEQQAVKTPAKPVPTTISEEDEVNGFLNYFTLKSDYLFFIERHPNGVSYFLYIFWTAL